MFRHIDAEHSVPGRRLLILCALSEAAGLSAQTVAPGRVQFLFPRFIAADTVNSGIAIFNPGNQEARSP